MGILARNRLIKLSLKMKQYQGIIYLTGTQNFPKNKYFLTPDTHTYMGLSGSKKC